MSKEYFGTLGFVIVPDTETEKVLHQLTEKYTQEGDVIPNPYHLSLYHGHFKDVPEEIATELIEQISSYLGEEYSLNQIEPYGGKFLFWNVEEPYTELQHAHDSVIGRLAPFVDQEKVGLALKEGLKMSKQETENIRKYSYPLVKELFMPHYALLHRESGLEATGYKQHTARILEVQFVEIGGFSKINQVFLSSKN